MKKNYLKKVAIVLSVVLGMAVFGGCGGSKKISMDQFTFTGSAEFDDGKTYNVSVSSDKEKANALTLTVEGVDSYKVNGTWEYVENKGYKLHFEDGRYSYAYTVYNTDSKEFSFNYRMSLGDGIGVRNVIMSCANEEFAGIYDGKGLEKMPPIFASVGYIGEKESSIPVDGTLICLEDGTCVAWNEAFPQETGGSVERKGTWKFDESKNEYTILFNEPDQEVYYHDEMEEPAYVVHVEKDAPIETSKEMLNEVGPYVTTYDEKTDTYTLKYEQVLVDYCWRTGTYTPVK